MAGAQKQRAPTGDETLPAVALCPVHGEDSLAGSMEDPNAEIEGLKELQTEDGLHVNRLEQGKYQIVVTGEVLVSKDPGAL